ncbi:aminotransferase class V-fold PLP-dependent enzyme [Anaeromyxobacter paludicola]|uniref:Aminotransferase n=1 Tax=Anaeromyxobacter paludicola TaxID=2918171 RepID=A0ABM7X800_9BACT|nr:aminotransferase class V-fold PLP-dependent enzyme [Anaeromyxobacter paludicola]BDG07920.1 aminotransferase [Anaeromyxobacter paludicola]
MADPLPDLPPPRLGDRALFPDLAPAAYLNHAGLSPLSLPVRRAVAGFTDDYGRHGGGAFARWFPRRAALREKLARLLGASPEDLALTSSTSSGLIDVALSFPWRAGDRVVCFEGEFPANVVPWQRAAALFGLEVRFVPLAPFHRGDEEGLAAVEAELRAGARLVAVSAVQFQTGLAMPLGPLARLCHAHGAELAVDAVQALGATPLDVRALEVDYLAGGSHKWLMGLEGAGVLYVRPERVEALRFGVGGWLSTEDPVSFLSKGPGLLRYDRPLRRRADAFEYGSSSLVSLVALDAAVGLLLEVGVGEIRAWLDRYLDLLEPGLAERGFASVRAREPGRRSGMLCARPPPGVELERLRDRLAASGVAVAIPDGHVRFAPQWPNRPEEVPLVLSAIDRALRG